MPFKYLDLYESLSFYGAYHSNSANKAVHIIFVPVIFTTSLQIAASNVDPLLAHVAAGLYATSFFFMDPIAALLYLPVLGGMHYIGTSVLVEQQTLSFALFLLGWIMQFVGHGLFEGRKPALVDSFLQSIHGAVFFVWLEVLFLFGYRPELQKELERRIKIRQAKFN